MKDEFSYMVETVIYNELVSRGYEVFTGKTYRGEIDFIVKGDRGNQATYLLSDQKVIDREFGAYDSVNDAYPKYVISMDPLTMSREGVEHMTLLDFLLDENRLRFA